MSEKFNQRLFLELNLFKEYALIIVLSIIYDLYFLYFPIKNFVFYKENPVKEIPIRDIFFNVIPEYFDKNIQDIPQGILWLFSSVLLILPPFFSPIFHKNGIYSISNIITTSLMVVTVFTIRAINFNITIIPDSSYFCRFGQLNQPKNVYGNEFISLDR